MTESVSVANTFFSIVNVVDFFAVLLVIVIVYRAYRKGFIQVVSDWCIFILSAILAKLFSGVVATLCYNIFGVRTKLEALLLVNLEKSAPSGDVTSVVAAQIAEGVNTLVAQIGALKPVVMRSITTNSAVKGLLSSTATNKSSDVVRIVIDAIEPVILFGMQVVAFLGLMLLFLVILSFFISAFRGIIVKIPLISSLDNFLGLLVGLVAGLLVVIVYTMVLYAFLAMIGSVGVVDITTVTSSKVYTFIGGFKL